MRNDILRVTNEADVTVIVANDELPFDIYPCEEEEITEEKLFWFYETRNDTW